MATELQCYRKGCGKKFAPQDNKSDCCQHHPGAPVFHDAYKSWSCCNKRSTDFSVFLGMPGCAYGQHSNEKPAPPPAAVKEIIDDETIIKGPPPKPACPSERPSASEPLTVLPSTVGATLKAALEKLDKMSLQNEQKTDESTGGTGDVAVGTACKNSSCKSQYKGPESFTETCIYHNGVPVFHEGMKFWSCCQKKTTEFDKFMDQEGCKTGTHRWVLSKAETAKLSACKIDWHQTGGNITISVFAKCANPNKTVIKANQVFVDIHIEFENGKLFAEEIDLLHTVDVSKSSVKLLGSKVEIVLRKKDLVQWSGLKHLPQLSDNTQSS